VHSHPSPSCGAGGGAAYPNSLLFVTMGPARGRQLAPPIHSARGARSRGGGLGHVLLSWKDPHPPLSLARSNPPCEEWLTGLEAGALSSIGGFEPGCVPCVNAGRVG
jgi:hypothetical protein